MCDTPQYYIGRLKLDIIKEAYLVEVSFIDQPPRQDKLNDLPQWTISSKNAIWFVQEDQPYMDRAVGGERIKEELLSQFPH